MMFRQVSCRAHRHGTAMRHPVAADACIKAQGTSEPVEVTLPECPAFYKR
ncbi:Uncharacterised protein [Raoultella planticola]|uniref:Uncharacterized protein n=1 Tax=Raoultella planticola TaxID=575 RepID=A0A485ANJ5_RAOPL|nr:Uncharacterised protein [Raoultella planticola]